MVLWSVLRSPLILGSRFVATSQFVCVAGLMIGFCMMRFSTGGDFRTDSSTLSTFLMLLTLSFNTFVSCK